MTVNKLGLLTTKIGSGVTPRGGQSVYQDSGTYLIRSQNIYNHKFEKNGLVCISKEIAEKMKSVEIMKEDVLINITGDSVARVYLVPDEILPARVNQHVCILRTKPELNPHYLYYFLINPTTQNHLLSIAGIGGTRNALTKEMLYNLIIEYPDLPTQEKIVKQLNTIKNKIITLENQNRILEQIAQAIFKSWFVDFDGVTEFEDSELGRIPKGWSIGKLEDYLELTKGVSYKSKELLPSNKALVSLKSINRGGGYTERGLKSFDGKYKDEQIVYENDIIIAQTDLTQDAAVIGKPAIVRNSEEFDILIASLDLLIARPKNNENLKFYIYHILLTDEFQNHIYGYTNGTGVLHLAKDGVPSYQFLIPSKKILEKFNQIISAIIQKNHDNHSHIHSLTKIRDILLPKLMSGEIRV